MSTTWADYLDARLRLVHEWAGEGVSFDTMAQRLTPDPHQLALLLLTPTTPPLPGSSRDRMRSWQMRAERLQRELIAMMARVAPPDPQPDPPRITQVRALLSDPDPDRCGCRYWTDDPPAHAHHTECSQAPPPPSSKP